MASQTKKAASTQPCLASGEHALPENVIARAKEVLQQLESGHQPAESVKEVPVATSVPAKTRKKPRSVEDAGQMSLRWVNFFDWQSKCRLIKHWIPADDDEPAFHWQDTHNSNESPWKPKEVLLDEDRILVLDAE